MDGGIRATVTFSASAICPVTELSEATGTTVDSVTANVSPTDCGECVTEFSLAGGPVHETEATPIFSHGETRRYRLVHDEGIDCPCECLGQYGCPVARYVARDGTLTLVFHAADYDQLQTVVTALRERFSGMDIKRFVRSPAGEESEDDTFVDRSKLTDRQLDVLETAYEMGYFERPRRANATDVAAALGINPSTFRGHLVAAQRKLLEDLL